MQAYLERQYLPARRVQTKQYLNNTILRVSSWLQTLPNSDREHHIKRHLQYLYSLAHFEVYFIVSRT